MTKTVKSVSGMHAKWCIYTQVKRFLFYLLADGLPEEWLNYQTAVTDVFQIHSRGRGCKSDAGCPAINSNVSD